MANLTAYQQSFNEPQLKLAWALLRLKHVSLSHEPSPSQVHPKAWIRLSIAAPSVNVISMFSYNINFTLCTLLWGPWALRIGNIQSHFDSIIFNNTSAYSISLVRMVENFFSKISNNNTLLCFEHSFQHYNAGLSLAPRVLVSPAEAESTPGICLFRKKWITT